MSAESSGGSAENVRRVHSGDFDFGMSYGELDAAMPQAALWTLLASHMVVYW